MRDAINEKNVDFQKSYRQQKELVTAHVIRLVCNILYFKLFIFHSYLLNFFYY